MNGAPFHGFLRNHDTLDTADTSSCRGRITEEVSAVSAVSRVRIHAVTKRWSRRATYAGRRDGASDRNAPSTVSCTLNPNRHGARLARSGRPLAHRTLDRS